MRMGRSSGKPGIAIICWTEPSVEQLGIRQNAVELNGAAGNARQSSAMHSEHSYKHSIAEKGGRIHHGEC